MLSCLTGGRLPRESVTVLGGHLHDDDSYNNLN